MLLAGHAVSCRCFVISGRNTNEIKTIFWLEQKQMSAGDSTVSLARFRSLRFSVSQRINAMAMAMVMASTKNAMKYDYRTEAQWIYWLERMLTIDE